LHYLTLAFGILGSGVEEVIEDVTKYVKQLTGVMPAV
jgi:hypothetical protein